MPSIEPRIDYRIQKTRAWLANDALPLWSARAVDWEQGGFVENLSLTGERMDGAKRSMVQARQIFTYRFAADLGLWPVVNARRLVEHSADFLAAHAFLPSGAVAHCVERDGRVQNPMADLYAQAFAIFGMANAFRMSPKPVYRERAVGVVRYLERERRVAAGGFTEVKEGVQYQSNPHMHLFEAFLAWMEVEPGEKLWRGLADDVFELARGKFVDAESGLLAEHFDERWRPVRTEGRFMFEPGHQYEWSWLLKWYERLTGKRAEGLAERLFRTSEEHGIMRSRGTTYDEVWSDFAPKKRSARFWPQCERIKAAVALGEWNAGDEALDALLRYTEAPVPGLWYDTWNEDGSFVEQPVKASSLYHIIGGMGEYLRLRAAKPA